MNISGCEGMSKGLSGSTRGEFASPPDAHEGAL